MIRIILIYTMYRFNGYAKILQLIRRNGLSFLCIEIHSNMKGEETEETAELSAGALFMQGVATSIDALSVGFTISEYGWLMALVCSLIVATVTFFICEAGLSLGKKFGTKLSGKASILGGVILIGIGLEIFISGVFG